MNTMKRFGLTALCVVGVTLLANTEAWAWNNRFTIQFLNTGDEPNATGQATVVVVNTEFPDYKIAKVTVSCQHLTPGASYSTMGEAFIAGGSGRGKVTSTFGLVWRYPGDDPVWDLIMSLAVCRLNADGTGTLVLIM